MLQQAICYGLMNRTIFLLIKGSLETEIRTVILFCMKKDSIYYAAGDGNCGVKLKLSDDGTKITEVWRNKSFDSFMGGIVKIGNYMYGSGTVKPELLGNKCNHRCAD